mmetsp:Transcript_62058/g.174996  ORF Transcript_62058/g.174996 Transcript_62058/m.174996 type:complete len:226 (+) Transcript_62058:426-1103(+)
MMGMLGCASRSPASMADDFIRIFSTASSMQKPSSNGWSPHCLPVPHFCRRAPLLQSTLEMGKLLGIETTTSSETSCPSLRDGTAAVTSHPRLYPSYATSLGTPGRAQSGALTSGMPPRREEHVVSVASSLKPQQRSVIFTSAASCVIPLRSASAVPFTTWRTRSWISDVRDRQASMEFSDRALLTAASILALWYFNRLRSVLASARAALAVGEAPGCSRSVSSSS